MQGLCYVPAMSDPNPDRSELEAALERLQRLSANGSALRDERLKGIASELAEWASRQWAYADAPNLVVYSLIELAWSYPKRAHDLIEGMRTLMLADRLVPSIILARALVETIAMGRYFIERIEAALAAGDFAKLEAQFLRFYAGSKIGNAPIKSVHINDALRDLEEADLRYLSYLVDKHPKLWKALGSDPVTVFRERASLLKTYDKLSEISHPNGLGTQYLYPAADAPDNTETIDYFKYMTGAAVWQGHHLLTALARTTTLPDRFVTTFPDRHRFSDGHPLQSTAKP